VDRSRLPLNGAFTLPGGYLDERGVCHREAMLRPMTGRDEEWLPPIPPSIRSAPLITALLARCVKAIGARRANAETIRALTAGDRDFLLLMLRRLTFGETISLILVCPEERCGAKMDVEIALDEIPVESRALKPVYRITLPEAPPIQVEFRLPSGRDLEQLADMASSPAEDPARGLLAACATRFGELPSVGAAEIAQLSPESRALLEREIELHSPKVELDMETTCPECSREFSTLLDPLALLLDEVRQGRAALDREIHTLAFHYHWARRELLGLTRPERQRYIRLLAQELGANA